MILASNKIKLKVDCLTLSLNSTIIWYNEWYGTKTKANIDKLEL